MWKVSPLRERKHPPEAWRFSKGSLPVSVCACACIRVFLQPSCLAAASVDVPGAGVCLAVPSVPSQGSVLLAVSQLSPVSHPRWAVPWAVSSVCCPGSAWHRAVDLRSQLKCPMETSPNLSLWGKGEEEFAAGFLPRAVCGRMGHHMTPSRPLFQGFGSLRDTRYMLMFGTNVI